jgi:hypothetical protein
LATASALKKKLVPFGIITLRIGKAQSGRTLFRSNGASREAGDCRMFVKKHRGLATNPRLRLATQPIFSSLTAGNELESRSTCAWDRLRIARPVQSDLLWRRFPIT